MAFLRNLTYWILGHLLSLAEPREQQKQKLEEVKWYISHVIVLPYWNLVSIKALNNVTIIRNVESIKICNSVTSRDIDTKSFRFSKIATSF